MSEAPQRSTLFNNVLQLVLDTAAAARGTEHAAQMNELVDRLHAPLRVAIAGKVKAGKSTLLNALVGDQLAPTDAGECTRIVTWYRHGLTYRVTLTPRTAPPRQVPFTRSSGALEIALDGFAAEDVERLDVEWPVPTLARMTLIDTPGIGSLSADTSARTLAFLTPDDEQTTPSDAVVYLLRHLHQSDVAFLHAFHEEEYAQPSPVNCVAVLSRADEVAGGRLDAMESAARIGRRYGGDPRLRRLVQRVVPVAGLLAQAGANLRELEFRRLRLLAEAEPAEVASLLLTVDRFVNEPTAIALAPAERQALLDRFGLFGVKLAIDRLSRGMTPTASQLADHLVQTSGINDLREVLLTQFSDRRDTLKARSALLAVQRLLATTSLPRGAELAMRVEQIRAGAHEFDELRLLNAVRAGEVDVRPEEIEEIEQLLGSRGGDTFARLGLGPDTPTTEVRAELFATLARWKQRAENPASSPARRAASQVVVRTCEGVFATLSAGC